MLTNLILICFFYILLPILLGITLGFVIKSNLIARAIISGAVAIIFGLVNLYDQFGLNSLEFFDGKIAGNGLIIGFGIVLFTGGIVATILSKHNPKIGVS